jgi:Co/Zn/Cd efflux system component
MSAHCCEHENPAPGQIADLARYRRILWVALLVNAAMFLVELGAGFASGSLSLLADAIDFAGDALNYGVSLAVLALLANVSVAWMLYAFREGDANMRSVWLCSRNDAIGNMAVFLAALGVFGTGSAWPDLLVATLMATLALHGGWQVMRQARKELGAPVAPGAGDGHAGHAH